MRIPRKAVDRPFDWLRYKLDTRSSEYQPLPWEDPDGHASGRAFGTLTRWNAMRPVVAGLDIETALDVGANLGWFSFAMSRLGVRVIAIERHAPYYRTILYSARRIRDDHVSVLVTDLNPEAASFLPTADCVLFLSVWHHVVRDHGLPYANELLGRLWERCSKVMFFETGETEMSPKFGLPDMGSSPDEWLVALLEGVCVGGRVDLLGTHAVPDRCGAGNERHLFSITRIGK